MGLCSFEQVLVMLIPVLSSQGEALLPSIGIPQIKTSILDSCIVLVAQQTSSTSTQSFQLSSQIVSDLFASSLRHSHIPYGALSIDEVKRDRFTHFKLFSAAGSAYYRDMISGDIIVMRQKVKDRTCLLTSGLKHFELKGYVYVGPLDIPLLLGFINEFCFTFWTEEGKRSEAGMIRDHLLASLSRQSQGLTLKELHQRCGPNLQEYFYSGVCNPQWPTESHDQNDEHCRINREEKQCQESKSKNDPEINRYKESPALLTCPVIDYMPSEKEFRDEYLFRSQPLIIRGAVKKWDAFRKWSNSYFKEKFGNKSVHVKLAPVKGDYEGVEPVSLWEASNLDSVPKEVLDQLAITDLVMVRPHGTDMNFSAFIDLIETNRSQRGNFSAYLEYASLSQIEKVLKSDTAEMPFIDSLLKLRHLNLWLSDGNTLGKLHMDQFDNVLCQLSGRKQVILFHPFNDSRLYQGHLLEATLRFDNGTFRRDRVMENTAMNMSPLDITQPDFQKLPLSAELSAWNCTLGPGDALYLPAFWWHEVQSYPDLLESRNLAVNFWYNTGFCSSFILFSNKITSSKNRDPHKLSSF